MKIFYVLSFYSDGGAPTIAFFPDYQALHMALYAISESSLSKTVLAADVPEFDSEKGAPVCTCGLVPFVACKRAGHTTTGGTIFTVRT